MNGKGMCLGAWLVLVAVLMVVIRGEMAAEDGRTNSNDINEEVQQVNDDQQIPSDLGAFLSRRKHPSPSGVRGRPRPPQDSNWSAANPSSSSASASTSGGLVACHVEMQVVQRFPGHCIRLAGGRIRACQTPNNWLSLNAQECLAH